MAEDSKSERGSIGSRFRGVLGQVRQKGAASLREVQRSAKAGVNEAGQRLKHGQEAVGAAVEIRRVIKQAQDALRRGNAPLAYRALEEELERRGDDPKLVLAFWEAALACERASDAVPVMKRLIRKLAPGNPARAAELWLELGAGAPDPAAARMDPGSLVRLAPALIEEGQGQAAVRALREAADPGNPGLSPGLAMRLVETAREVDPRAALMAVTRVLDDPDLHEAKRAKLAELQSELQQAAAKAPDPALDSAAADSTASDPAKLEPEDLAQQIGDLGARVEEEATATAVESNERFVDMGEADMGEAEIDGPLELDAPGGAPAGEPRAEDYERFVSLDGDPGPELEEPAHAPGEVSVATPAPEPELALDSETFDRSGGELGAADDAEPMAELVAEHEPEIAGQFEVDEALPEAAVLPDLPSGAESAEATVFDAAGLVLDAGDLAALEAFDAEPEPEAVLLASESSESFELAAPDQGAPIELEPLGADLVAQEVAEVLAPAARFGTTKVMDAVPAELDQRGLIVAVEGGRRGRVDWLKVQAVALAEISGLAVHPVIVIDLATNWRSEGDAALRLVRLRSDRFDARSLVSGTEDPVDAFTIFLTELLEHSGAVPLPNVDAVLGGERARFASLADYEAEVLQVGS